MPRNNSKARREQRQATAKSSESDIMVARRRMDELQDAWESKNLPADQQLLLSIFAQQDMDEAALGCNDDCPSCLSEL